MSKKEVYEQKAEALLLPIIEANNFELVDVEYVKEGPEYYLRIYIDKESGIDLNDCEKVSNEINEILDKADYIKEQYYLEVSSPGIERLLRKDWQLKKFKGDEVNIKLFKKDENGKKEYTGILGDITENTLDVDIGENVKIDRKVISQVKTVYED